MIPIPPASAPTRARTARVALVCTLALLVAVATGLAPAPPSRHAELVLLSTNDVHGRLAPCECRTPRGGLARLVAFADSVRATRPVLWLDAGSLLGAPGTPAAMGGADAGADSLLLHTMARHGLAALNVGETELSRGLAMLRARAADAGVRLLSANVCDRRTGSPVAEPWAVLPLAGRRVGVIGVLATEADLGPMRDSLRVGDPRGAVQAAVRALAGERVAAVVLLSGLGASRTEALVRAVDGIDVAVVARGAPLEARGRTVGRTALVCAGEQGQAMGVVTLSLDPAGRVLAVRSGARLIGPDVRDDPAVAAAVAVQLRRAGAAAVTRTAPFGP